MNLVLWTSMTSKYLLSLSMQSKKMDRRSWTQIGNPETPAAPRHNLPHMLSHWAKLMDLTSTVLGLKASSQVANPSLPESTTAKRNGYLTITWLVNTSVPHTFLQSHLVLQAFVEGLVHIDQVLVLLALLFISAERSDVFYLGIDVVLFEISILKYVEIKTKVWNLKR